MNLEDLTLDATNIAILATLALVVYAAFLAARWARERRRRQEEDDAPFVCPGCHCVGAEPHAGYCIDAEIEREREDAVRRGDFGGDDDVDCDDEGDIYR